MGFFDGLGRRRRRRGFRIGWGESDDDGYHGDNYLDQLAAEGDATRIRLSDATYEGVSRVPTEGEPDPTPVGPKRHAIPDEKPDPAAQWDDAKGCWIKWDPSANRWVEL